MRGCVASLGNQDATFSRHLGGVYIIHRFHPVVYNTGNGTADNLPVVEGRVKDSLRQRYFELYLTELSKALEEGSDVRGYFIWSREQIRTQQA